MNPVRQMEAVFICSWYPLILSTRSVSPRELRSSERWWGIILATAGGRSLLASRATRFTTSSRQHVDAGDVETGFSSSTPGVASGFGLCPSSCFPVSSPHPGPSLLSSPSLHSNWQIPSPPPPHSLISSRNAESTGEFPCL